MQGESPYVLSSTAAAVVQVPGPQARVRAPQAHVGALVVGLAGRHLPLSLLEGTLLLDASVDLLLKPTHLLLEVTNQVDYALEDTEGGRNGTAKKGEMERK